MMYVIQMPKGFLFLEENGSFSVVSTLNEATSYDSREDAEWDIFQAKKTVGRGVIVRKNELTEK